MNNTSSSSTSSTPSSAILGFISHKLGTSYQWAQRAISVLYSYQTAEEQEAGDTSLKNGAGFNGTDAFILSSFATQLEKGRNLSPKQLAIAFKKLPKYRKQILASIPSEKLEAVSQQALEWAASQPTKEAKGGE